MRQIHAKHGIGEVHTNGRGMVVWATLEPGDDLSCAMPPEHAAEVLSDPIGPDDVAELAGILVTADDRYPSNWARRAKNWEQALQDGEPLSAARLCAQASHRARSIAHRKTTANRALSPHEMKLWRTAAKLVLDNLDAALGSPEQAAMWCAEHLDEDAWPFPT